MCGRAIRLFDAALQSIRDIPKPDVLLITKMFLGRDVAGNSVNMCLSTTTVDDPDVTEVFNKYVCEELAAGTRGRTGDGPAVWDSGLVRLPVARNVRYGGPALAADADTAAFAGGGGRRRRELSPQYALSCFDAGAGCDGGDVLATLREMAASRPLLHAMAVAVGPESAAGNDKMRAVSCAMNGLFFHVPPIDPAEFPAENRPGEVVPRPGAAPTPPRARVPRRAAP